MPTGASENISRSLNLQLLRLALDRQVSRSSQGSDFTTDVSSVFSSDERQMRGSCCASSEERTTGYSAR